MKSNIISKCILIISALVLFIPHQAAAEETICSDFIGNTTVDNLLIPGNSECNLENTRIMGTIQIASNATMTARGILVIGNIQAENALQVNILENSRIGGSVQIKQGGDAIISDSIINNDIQFESNSELFQALRNIVGGNMQVIQNNGGAEIQQNIVDGNLQCKENAPVPTGGANTVYGTKEDQCSQLAGLNETENKCNLSRPTFRNTGRLHIPRLNVLTQNGVTDYWATLYYVPELSSHNNFVFELRDSTIDLGQCDQ